MRRHGHAFRIICSVSSVTLIAIQIIKREHDRRYINRTVATDLWKAELRRVGRPFARQKTSVVLSA
jgi:hypothetical protein